MSDDPLSRVTHLAFDIFGTVLDLTGGITPPTQQFLRKKGAAVSGETFWDQWRARQRLPRRLREPLSPAVRGFPAPARCRGARFRETGGRAGRLGAQRENHPAGRT